MFRPDRKWYAFLGRLTPVIEADLSHALRQAPGCPICWVVEEEVNRAFRWFFIDNYNDISTLMAIAEHPALCREHAQRLLRDGNDALSMTFQFLILRERQGLLHLRKQQNQGHLSTPWSVDRWLQWLRRGLTRFPPSRGCRFCRASEETGSTLLAVLLEKLLEEDWRSRYQVSFGLCRRHLREGLTQTVYPEVARFLLEEADRRLETLETEFELYFRRLDVQHADEPKGKEQQAWQEALRYFSLGEPDPNPKKR